MAPRPWDMPGSAHTQTPKWEVAVGRPSGSARGRYAAATPVEGKRGAGGREAENKIYYGIVANNLLRRCSK